MEIDVSIKCKDCKQDKLLVSYDFRMKKGKPSFGMVCVECSDIRRELKRQTNIAKMYGMTLDEYKSLLLEHGNRCSICNKIDLLEVDHCHLSGKVRGLLCRACNLRLGILESLLDKKLLIPSLEYIDKHAGNYIAENSTRI